VWGRMRPRMGFALVRIALRAGVRTLFGECGSLGVGSRRSRASLHQHSADLGESERTGDARPTCGGSWVRCAIGAVGSCRGGLGPGAGCVRVWRNHRSIRPKQVEVAAPSGGDRS